jgi:hypothetical protein
MQHLDEVLEGQGHDSLVVVALKNVIECTHATNETLIGLVADNARETHRGEEAFEGFSVLDASWVVQGKDTKDVTGLKADTRLLNKLNYTVLELEYLKERVCE